MDPIYVVPAFRAKLFDGTNVDEIVEWTGFALVAAAADHVLLRVAPDEVLRVSAGWWVFATAVDPPAFVMAVPAWELSMRYVEHSGTPTTFPPVAAP